RSCERTRSESTRRNYKQVLDEFFVFMGGVNPTVVTPDDIRTWRDCLITAGKSSSTVILKLAVVRSFYQYLISADIINLNPALTSAVSLPELQRRARARRLSARDVNILLAGPDQSTIEGARDYALLLMLWKLSLGV